MYQLRGTAHHVPRLSQAGRFVDEGVEHDDTTDPRVVYLRQRHFLIVGPVSYLLEVAGRVDHRAVFDFLCSYLCQFVIYLS